MNKQQIYNETRVYEEREKPKSKFIYTNTSHGYSSQKYIQKIKEYGLPEETFDKCGIIPELNTIWYAKDFRLLLWRYESNDMEEISRFSSKVIYVDLFVPRPNIFNNKISHCLIVFTESQVIIYGVEKDTLLLINTDLAVNVPSKITSYCLNKGDIYIGCENGNVLQVIYRGTETWAFKLISLYNPNSSIIGHFVPAFLKRKKHHIISLSVGKKTLISLGRQASIYNIEGGIYKIKDVLLLKEYVDVQVIDDEGDSVFFYCVSKDGSRDFYENGFLMSKKCSLSDSMTHLYDIATKSSYSTFCIVHKTPYQGSVLNFIKFNEFQFVNYDKTLNSENQEIIALKDEIKTFYFNKANLYIVTDKKIIFYEILSIKKYLVGNRIEDVYNTYKQIGEREALVLYYQLVSTNEDVSKIEYLCLKSEENHLKALFSFIYREVKDFFTLPIKDLWTEQMRFRIEKTNIKFKNLLKKVKSANLKLGLDIIDTFVQSYFYVNLLNEYYIDIGNQTFCNLCLNEEVEFKKQTLKSLIDVFKANQSIDPLINALGNKCPGYLPVEEIYYQRGFDLLKKYPSREKLWESLKNFRNIVWNEDIIIKYNELKFFAGSITLIRQHFAFDYEKEVELLRTCTRCQGAISQGLEDSRDEFLYAFFEALILNLKEKSFGPDCMCCDTKSSMLLSEIIKIQNTTLERFLQEKTVTDNDPGIFELHWKYCAYRNDRGKATKSLLYLADNKSISLEQRIDLLEKAKTVSLYTEYQEDVKIRIELLDVQLELIERGVNDPLIKNMLLSADTIFNDYAFKFPDLALRIISISNFSDKNIIQSLWREGMKGDFAKAVNFLMNTKFDGASMDVEIVGDILVEKMKKGDRLGRVLLSAGFNYYDIQKYIEHRIKAENHPNLRSLLLEDFKDFTDDGKHFRKVEQYCLARKT